MRLPRKPPSAAPKALVSWDLERDGITQGLIERVILCPAKATHSYKEMLTGERASGALAFGTIFHAVLDKIYTNWHSPPTEPEVLRVLAGIEAANRAAVKVSGLFTSEMWQEFEETYGLCGALLVKYFENTQADWEQFNWITLEHKFRVPYLRHSDKAAPFSTIDIRGKIDGIFRDSKGKLWLFETKTKGRIQEMAIMDHLAIDLQVMLYMWAARHIHGEYPSGVIYNVCRRPGLRRKVKETLREFHVRTLADITKQPDHYFKRYPMYVSEEEQRQWAQEQLPALVDQVLRWDGGLISYMNSGACSNYGSTCDFLALCARGQKAHLSRKKFVFPELEGDEE